MNKGKSSTDILSREELEAKLDESRSSTGNPMLSIALAKDIINSTLNIQSDGIQPCIANEASVSITAPKNDNKEENVLQLKGKTSWKISLRPQGKYAGFNVFSTGRTGSSQLFLDAATPNVGINNIQPQAGLHIKSEKGCDQLRIDNSSGEIAFLIDKKGKVRIGKKTDKDNAEIESFSKAADLASGVDTKLPTQKAVHTYVKNQLTKAKKEANQYSDEKDKLVKKDAEKYVDDKFKAMKSYIDTDKFGAKTQVSNLGIKADGQINFANSTKHQHISLWGNGKYGIGIQSCTQYFRTGKHFAWYQGGSHVGEEALKPGKDGKSMMSLEVDKDKNTVLKLHSTNQNANEATILQGGKGRTSTFAGNLNVADKIKVGTENVETFGHLTVTNTSNKKIVGIALNRAEIKFLDFGKEHFSIRNKGKYLQFINTTAGSYYTEGTPLVALDGSGNLYVKGNLEWHGKNFPSSDERLKKEVQPIENTLQKLQRINGVTFKWNNTYLDNKLMKSEQDDALQFGVIAQDVEKVFPELVGEDKGYKTVNYNGLIPVILNAVKEQQTEIIDLKQELAEVKDLLYQLTK